MQNAHNIPWEQSGWHVSARGWITEQLAAHGYHAAGEPDAFHIRPWSLVMRVPTTGEMLYFKAVAPSLAHEPQLTTLLVNHDPEWLPRLLAVDLERSWMLFADAGVTFRSTNSGGGVHPDWHVLFPRYARLQQRYAGRDQELLHLGIIDRRPHTLGKQLAELLEKREILLIDQPESLSSAEYERLWTLVPVVEQMGRDLEAFGIPLTIQHDDFHDANIFVKAGHYTFADWGDCCLAHPFSTLLCLRSIAYRAGIAIDAPQLTALRDGYLEAWSDYGSPVDRLAAFELAFKLAMIGRALTWHRVIYPADPQAQSDDAGNVPGWLQEFLAHVD